MKKNYRAGLPGQLLLSILMVLTFWSFSMGASAAPANSAQGINTNEIMENDASVPFVDLMKMAMPFEEARPWLTKGNIRYDKNGWPVYIPKGGQAGTRFLNDIPAGTLPDGNYTVLYEGEGQLDYNHDARLISHSAGKDIISIIAGSDKKLRAILKIKQTNPKNPLRNIRILLPGGICANQPFHRVENENQCAGSRYLAFEQYHDSIVFNPDYLNYMKDFRVIRFMNMSGITRNPVRDWSRRNSPTKQTWSGKTAVRGAPVEIMVALANRLGADPWFCLPHNASNDYIQRFAMYVRQHLNPKLKVYIEYTNEAWNGIFTQTNYVKKKGLAMHLDKDRHKAGYKYYSMRSVQIFDIWEQAFGGTDRLVRVMGAWTPYARLTDMLLSYRDAYKKTDALAIAPYFYPRLTSARRARSVSDIFKLLYDKDEPYSIPNVVKLIEVQAKKARQYGVRLVAYEGGQHLVDWDNRNTTLNPTHLFIEANKSRQMGRAYNDLLNGWKKAGGTLFVHFSAPRMPAWYGSWGTKEYVTQPDYLAPKHQSILAFNRNSPCWWPSCASNRIARLIKPQMNPGKGVYALVSGSAAHSKNTLVDRALRLKNAESRRRKLAIQRLEAANKREMIRREESARRAREARKREKAKLHAYKLSRRNRMIKQQRAVRKRRAARRPNRVRRR
jgi:hypothetical protein